jgi:SAM-dependent methyltransferase
MDWAKWHRGYDSWPPLQARLDAVREQIADALSVCSNRRVRIISLCAGDGRDIIGALVTHPRRKDVSAVLIETNTDLVAQGEAAVAHFNLSPHVRFLCADATLSDTYMSIARADIVLVAGVLGNVREADEGRLVQSLRCLCQPGGTVIWTRNVLSRDGEHAVERIRELLNDAGFRENTLTRTAPSGFIVGTYTFHGDSQPLSPSMKLFEFTGYDQLNR